MQAFQEYGGLASFIRKLETEVNACRKDQPFVINPTVGPSSVAESQNADATMVGLFPEKPESSYQSSNVGQHEHTTKQCETEEGLKCLPERATLLENMLTPLQRFILDSDSTSVNQLMDGTLPQSLTHIISNAEYYGPTLFVLVINIVADYILENPSLSSTLQDKGLTDVIFHALLVKKLPAAREVYYSLGNVFSALCLNSRGYQAFIAFKPFEKLFRVFVSPEHLPTMSQKKSNKVYSFEVNGAMRFGCAMDDLVRHHPSLRSSAIAAIIKVLEELCVMGRDPKYKRSELTSEPDKVSKAVSITAAVRKITCVANRISYSNHDDDFASAPVQGNFHEMTDKGTSGECHSTGSKMVIPLEDYILNFMKFMEEFLGKTSNVEHCREFVREKGLVPLMSLFRLPNLPISFPESLSCQSISFVCSSILKLVDRSDEVLKEGVIHLKDLLHCLEYLHKPLNLPTNSIFLEEFNRFSNMQVVDLISQPTPLLIYTVSAHAYINMFAYLCESAPSNIHTILLNHWGSRSGLHVLKDLSSLYISLVWESTVLLNLSIDKGFICEFPRQLLEIDKNNGLQDSSEFVSNEVTSAMEALSTKNRFCKDINKDGQISSLKDISGNSSVDGKTGSSKICRAQLSSLLFGSSCQSTSQALSALFRGLVQLCVDSSKQSRRGHQILLCTAVPSTADTISLALAILLKSGVSWVPSTASVPKFRFTFYICFIRLTSLLLFDEGKYLFHLMIHKFWIAGGFDAFFNTLQWAMTSENTADIGKGLENSELPEETTEFLDAWLMLLEKLVKPKMLLESPNVFTPISGSFDPVQYLIHIHKRAFESILYLWNRQTLVAYGKKIAESMLDVIGHLLNGEKIIKERFAKSEDARTPAPDAGLNAAAAHVKQNELTVLMDMGFSRSLATEALLNTNSLPEAAEHLLTNRNNLSSGNSRAPDLVMDWEMSEADELQRAIDLSLVEHVSFSANQVESEPNKTEESGGIGFEQQEQPLSSEVLDEFILQIVDSCINLADALPDTVNKCCDLLISVAARNGKEWRDKNLIDFLLLKLHSQSCCLLQHLTEVNQPEFDKNTFGIKTPLLNVGKQFAVRLHLFVLIFKELKIPCAARIDEVNLLPVFIKILELISLCLHFDLDDPQTKLRVNEEQHHLLQLKNFCLKWLPFLVVIIDQYEGVAINAARKAPLLMVSERQWKWFDERTMKWNNYSHYNNKIIDDAYKSGDSTVNITESLRNCTVCLISMTQTNKETSKKCFIIFTTDCQEEKEKGIPGRAVKKEEHEATSKDLLGEELPKDESAENAVSKNLHIQSIHRNIIKRLTPEQCEELIGICVSLLQVPLEPDSAFAIMKLCLRLTRTHSNAVLFANLNGPKTLLSMTELSRFPDFTSYTALLFLHIMEDPVTLCRTMEKVIRSETVPGYEVFCNEMHSCFRKLGAAACRDPEVFTSVVSNNLHLTMLPAGLKEYNGRVQSYSYQGLVPSPSKSQITEIISNSEVADNVIFDLLHALTAKPIEPLEKASTAEYSSGTLPSTRLQNGGNGEDDLLSIDDILVMPLTIPDVVCFNVGFEENDGRFPEVSKGTAKKNILESSTLKNTPIIKKSEICRLLTELVRSYSQCARLITDYSVLAENSELVSEDCSALSFILDNLLHSQTVGDKETPILARKLITELLSCNQSIEAQTLVVLEVRLALIRALSAPESLEKHSQIQALIELISTMVKSQNQLGSSALKAQESMNNIIRIILENGIFMDLARIPHCLDLSSHCMVTTVNSALKLLETLCIKANMSSGTLTDKTEKKVRSSIPDGGAVSESTEGNTMSASCSYNEQDLDSNSEFENVDTVEIEDEEIENLRQSRTSNSLADLNFEDLAFPMEEEENRVSQIRSHRGFTAAEIIRDYQEFNDLDSTSDADIEDHEDRYASILAHMDVFPLSENYSSTDRELESVPFHHPGAYMQATAEMFASSPRMITTLQALLNREQTYMSSERTRLHPDYARPVCMRLGNTVTASSFVNSTMLFSIPSTFNRWKDESSFLEDNIHDCLTGLKPAIIKCLEANMDKDLSKKKESKTKFHDKQKPFNTSVIAETEEASVDQNAIAQAPLEVTESSSELENNALPTINMPEENASAQESEVLENVDASFLASLPQSIRDEVIADQLRQQRLRQRYRNESNDNSSHRTSFADRTFDFPDLSSSFHEAALTSMEDRIFYCFDPELESQVEGNRAISHVLRPGGHFVRSYTSHTPFRGQSTLSSFPQGSSTPLGNAYHFGRRAIYNSLKFRGRFLLDHEALTCLLVLLFLDESKLNTEVLNRVLSNVCYHEPSRNWIVKALLSIMERTKNQQMVEGYTHVYQQKKPDKGSDIKESNTTSHKRKYDSSRTDSPPTWLSISMDTTNYRAYIFQIQRESQHSTSKKLSSRSTQNVLNPSFPLVTIHPIASPDICGHVLDTFICLARTFPAYFLPEISKKKISKESNVKEQKCVRNPSSSSKIEGKTVKSETSNIHIDSDFWDILIKLDHSLNSTSCKGKSVLRNHSGSSLRSSPGYSNEESKIGFESSPLAQLIGLLAHPLIKCVPGLTDRLLKILSLISNAFSMPERNLESNSNSNFCQQMENKDFENACMSPIHEEVFETTTGTEHRTVKHYLKLVVEVFTSKTCSEKGLTYAVKFLLAFSRGGGCNRTRRTVLFLLLEGCRQLSSVVCSDIFALTTELRCNFEAKAFEPDKKSKKDGKSSVKGTIRDRYTNSAVVITDPLKGKEKGERELLNMQTLAHKTRSQAFFLCLLKLSLTVLRESKELGKNILRVQSQSTKHSPILQELASFHLSNKLNLDKLWDILNPCLSELAKLPDEHAVLVLQPTVEAFFLLHAPSGIDKKKVNYTESKESEMSHIQDMPSGSSLAPLLNPTDTNYCSESDLSSSLSSDMVKFLTFAETHKTILNQILRQSSVPLASGPFSVLVNYAKILDFDIKRRHFRHQLEGNDRGYGHNLFSLHVRREHVFEDSYRELHRRYPEEWKNRFHIHFEGEEGADAGGLLREWFTIIAREIFNPMYALFTTSPGDRVTYMINPSSHCNPDHLSYFKFAGRVIAKAIYDNKLLESYFTRSFYKHILGKCVKYTDMECEDYSFYQGLVFLLEHSVEELGYELTFSTEVQEFGVTDIRDLKPNGRNIHVCEENKHEYVRLVCQEKMTGAIRQQLKAFLQGFYEIIPKKLISLFNEQELELLISGLPNIDIDDLKANTEYYKYQRNSLQIQWLWRALRSFDQADRAKFLQFVTGTSKVPLQGFSALEGMTGIQKFSIHRDDRSTDRLPCAHTCFNQLDLPTYDTYDKLRSMLLKAIHECSEGFGFA